MKKIALMLLIGILCLSMVACGNPKITNSADGYIGTNYEDVVAELKDCGFTNIETQEVQDLTSASDMQDGDVGEISVDGVTDFEEGTKFEADVPIIVTYHTIPKLQIPVSSDDLQNHDLTKLRGVLTQKACTCLTGDTRTTSTAGTSQTNRETGAQHTNGRAAGNF